jgi:hypothetical protein
VNTDASKRGGATWCGVFADAIDKAGIQVHVGAGQQPQADAGAVQLGLKGGDRAPDAGRIVVIHARIDVRRAGDGADAVVECDTRHLERHVEIGGAVVDGGEQMAVEIEHRTECMSRAGRRDFRHSRAVRVHGCVKALERA